MVRPRAGRACAPLFVGKGLASDEKEPEARFLRGTYGTGRRSYESLGCARSDYAPSRGDWLDLHRLSFRGRARSSRQCSPDVDRRPTIGQGGGALDSALRLVVDKSLEAVDNAVMSALSSS